MENNLNADYWQERWKGGNTPWDIGGVSPAIQRYFDQIDPEATILIPGAGAGHEADYLWKRGYQNVYICDWAAGALAALQNRLPDFPANQLLQEDFFKLDLQVDYLVEQTFFCAISPDLRSSYVEKAYSILKTGGEVGGLLFAKPFPFQGPPFGGERAEYLGLFGTRFEVIEMQVSPHSIPPRLGNELFFRCRKV